MTAANTQLKQLSDADRRVLESWLVEFDQGWAEGRLAERFRTLPPPGHPLRTAALIELVKIDLERQWRLGRRPPVEGYLHHYPELGTPDTLPADLIQAEYEVRLQLGTTADLADFARRFPRQADKLRQLIRQAGQVVQEAEQARPSSGSLPPRGLSPAASPVELPERFAHYRIVKKLGQGGMGAVYLAHDTRLDRRVALKVPHFKPEDGTIVLERFRREARAAATLEHPNICPVHEVGVHDGVHYLTMAFIEGKPLADLIDPARPLPPRQAALLVRKLALALQEAHARGVVHRDLKPANVMINRRKEPVIMDFGLARRGSAGEARLTRVGAVVGTPAYMAPEQVGGNPDAVGPGCDVYSLGVMLYELLTGVRPFEGPVMAVLGQLLTQEPEPPSKHRPGLDPRLETICLTALAKKAEDRYPTMADLAAALTDYVRTAVPPGPPADRKRPDEPFADLTLTQQQPGPWLRRVSGRRLGTLTAAAAGILLLGAVLYVATNHGTIAIELSDPTAAVEVEVDGESVVVRGGGDPVRLRAGEHGLVVTGKDFETVARSFTVRRGHNPAVRVELKPKDTARAAAREPAIDTPAPAPPPDNAAVAFTNSIGLKFVLIDPKSKPDGGRFRMGSPPGEVGREDLDRRPRAGSQHPLPAGDQETQHWVRLTRPYYLAVTEITRAQWERVMGADGRTFRMGQGPEHPVGVSGNSVGVFLQRLAALEQEAKRAYRLPTEAEWEYACRAGGTTAYHFGADRGRLGDHDWYADNSDGTAHPVATKKPNAWGLYDLHGNLREWCQDFYELYPNAETVDPLVGGNAPLQFPPSLRVIRGGSYACPAKQCRSAWRFRCDTHTLYFEGFGIRVALTAPAGAVPAVPEKPAPRAAAASPEPASAAAPPSPAPAPPPDNAAVAFINSVGLKFVLIDPKTKPDGGRFLMGSPQGEEGRDSLPRDYFRYLPGKGAGNPLPEGDQERQHWVRLTKPYFVATTEVTEAQFEKVMGPKDRGNGRGPDHAQGVLGHDAEEFVRKLCSLPQERPGGRVYRLLTEAEWEYACRAGTTTAYSFGNDRSGLPDHGWFAGNSDSGPRPVGKKLPNAWGLHDMHGNVGEWCQDFYELYPQEEQRDPVAGGGQPLDRAGPARVVRGGSHRSSAERCRSAWRFRHPTRTGVERFGIRVAVTAP